MRIIRFTVMIPCPHEQVHMLALAITHLKAECSFRKCMPNFKFIMIYDIDSIHLNTY